MGHYAKVVDGVVTNVIVAEEEFFETFIDDSPGQWIQTSYNTFGGVHYDPETGQPSEDQSKALRKNFASVGMVYDRQRDAFRHAAPKFQSWVLNEESCQWEPPVPLPNTTQNWEWDEENTAWVEMPDPVA